jgi:phosphoglycerate dehydrogenase-like enzyme
MTLEPAVAVYGGRFGEALLGGLETLMPQVRFVRAGSEEARDDADVLATLVDDIGAIKDALTPAVRWIHVLGAGVDGFPFEVVGERFLTCSRGAGAPAIAEFVLAAMLAFEKQLPRTWITRPPERWNVADLGSLEGKTLGLVGVGAIGRAVARRARAFDMTTVGLRRRSEVGTVEAIALCSSLDDLLSVSDHVVLAAPATPQTRHMFDRSAFARMKPQVHFVNVSRGTLVDQDALVEALDHDRLAMATLDVVDPEPLPSGHVLYRHPKVNLSPHVSWSSPRTALRTLELFRDNLVRYRRGDDLEFLVDVEAGY